MKATLRLYLHSPYHLRTSRHLRLVLDDAPPVLNHDTAVCLFPGGPSRKIRHVTYDPFTRSLTAKLEDLVIVSPDGDPQGLGADLAAAGWEEDV